LTTLTKSLKVHNFLLEFTPSENLRWWIGFEVPNDTHLHEKLVATGLSLQILPASKVVTNTFPWKSIISPMYAPMWVYEPLKEYIAAKPGLKMTTSVEFYYEKSGLLHYVVYQDWEPVWWD
jgi:hypothetical protein